MINYIISLMCYYIISFMLIIIILNCHNIVPPLPPNAEDVLKKKRTRHAVQIPRRVHAAESFPWLLLPRNFGLTLASSTLSS